MTVATLERMNRVTLLLSEEKAQLLMALLVGSINWARAPWAKDVYDALMECGVEETDDQADSVRHEVERYIERTADVCPIGSYGGTASDEDDGL